MASVTPPWTQSTSATTVVTDAVRSTKRHLHADALRLIKMATYATVSSLVAPHTRVSFAFVGAGDREMVYNCLATPVTVDSVVADVEWGGMRHMQGDIPRLFAVQGEVTVDADGTWEALYRHPADEAPVLFAWTQPCDKIRQEVGKVVGREFNHALIQQYRNGRDHKTEHSDKTLDILLDSPIVNYSLGRAK